MFYLIWNKGRKQWWAPGGHGYVTRVDDAGHFSGEAAARIMADDYAGTKCLVSEARASDTRWPVVMPTADSTAEPAKG